MSWPCWVTLDLCEYLRTNRDLLSSLPSSGPASRVDRIRERKVLTTSPTLYVLSGAGAFLLDILAVLELIESEQTGSQGWNR